MKRANQSVNLEDLDIKMLELIVDLETELGYELTITSGYRSPDHPIEAAKSKPGEHPTGLAVDVAVIGGTAVYEFVQAAMKFGVKRIGINRNKNFIHIGLDESRVTSIWTY